MRLQTVCIFILLWGTAAGAYTTTVDASAMFAAPVRTAQYVNYVSIGPTAGICVSGPYNVSIGIFASLGGMYRAFITCPTSTYVGQGINCTITLQDWDDSPIDSTSTVWADFDSNGALDANEPQFSFDQSILPNQSITHYVSLIVPATSPVGRALVRLNTQYLNSPEPNSTSAYSVNFISPGGCPSGYLLCSDNVCRTSCGAAPGAAGGGPAFGGGLTMVEKECTYNWDCTPWGLCSGGKQRRNCTNIGTCTGQENKPIEEMQCAMALFDISLNLTNITVVDNKTLQFQLDLKEKQGAEKFDAYIRYTVTDEDENTVFSYTETKAIQNNLSIVKEISDIDLTKGKYKLLVEVFYGNQQRTYAEKEISVLGGKLVPAGKQMNMTEISTSNVPGEGAENPLFAALIAQKDIVMALAIFLLIVILLFVLRDWLRSMLGKAAELLANAATACGAALAGAAEPLLSAARLRRVTQVGAADLVGKKVYSVNGQRIGVVRDAVFEKGKVSGIKVKLDRKYAFSYKGIILEYWLVKSVSEIVIVDETVAEHLKKYLKGKPRAKGS